MAPVVSSTSDRFISAAAARRQHPGLSTGRLQRLAVIGRVRTEVLPGTPPRYSETDLRHVLEGEDERHQVRR